MSLIKKTRKGTKIDFRLKTGGTFKIKKKFESYKNLGSREGEFLFTWTNRKIELNSFLASFVAFRSK